MRIARRLYSVVRRGTTHMDSALTWLILGGRGVRSFALGIIMVALPLALLEDELSTLQSSVVFCAGMAGTMTQMQFTMFLTRHLSRMAILAFYNIAMAAACGIMAIHCNFALATIAVFIGALSLQPNISVHAPIEQATLADTCSGKERTGVFAWKEA